MPKCFVVLMAILFLSSLFLGTVDAKKARDKRRKPKRATGSVNILVDTIGTSTQLEDTQGSSSSTVDTNGDIVDDFDHGDSSYRKSPQSMTSSSVANVDASYRKGLKALKRKKYGEAAEHFWFAWHGSSSKGGTQFSLEDVYNKFLQCFSARGILDQGYVRIAEALIEQKNYPSAHTIISLAIKANPNNIEARLLGVKLPINDEAKKKALKDIVEIVDDLPIEESLAQEIGVNFFSANDYENSMKYLQMAYEANNSNTYALSYAIYNRQYISAWGQNGTQFEQDMNDVVTIIQNEELDGDKTSGETQTVVLPFITLNYDIPSDLKLKVAQWYTRWETKQARKMGFPSYDQTKLIKKYRKMSSNSGFRIKLGYVSSNFKSKAASYVGKDMFQFHDRSKFEVHVYATSEPDPPHLIESQMGGVDFRAQIRRQVEFFHEVEHLNAKQLAEQIFNEGIHLLIDWDGHSNFGNRAMGLFSSTPAPIQVAHQEYIGTMGAEYIQYIVTDEVASPVDKEQLYSEKFIYIPHTFLTNSFAYQAPAMKSATREIPPEHSPERNGCNGAPASFVFCNFGKQLKYQPDQFRHWLNILRRVNDSVLCLLEYPSQAVPYVQSFVDDVDYTLRDRVRFLKESKNPYEHQQRNAAFCNAILDTRTWNGRTTTQDALWAGVPFVASIMSDDMGGRVGASLLHALNLTELLAKNQNEYEDIAVRLATDPAYYKQVRNIVVDSCLVTSPRRHPLWDLERHVANLERGFSEAWRTYISGSLPKHVFVKDVIDFPNG